VTACAAEGADRPATTRAGVRRALLLALVAALSVAVVRSLLVQSFVIPSASMEPVLQVGDRVLVSRVDAHLASPRRGDVVVFDGDGVFDPPSPEPRTALARLGTAVGGALGVPVDEHDYVKRVVGLPGDRVACCDDRGRLTVDGLALDEPYVYPGDLPSQVRFSVVVPPGRLWVMGDHRSDSADSRSHLGDPGGGTVPVDRVIGRVVAVYWPVNRLGGVPRPALEEIP
jgi:signal peptidase I